MGQWEISCKGLLTMAPPFAYPCPVYKDSIAGSGTVELKGKRVAVYSAGCDRKLGTADDVKTW
jgi:hypothetical protein